MTIIPIKKALISVSDKTYIVDFTSNLIKSRVEIISTGGTGKALTQAKIPHQNVENITEFPEIFGGRVKTLHPKIHGGILAKRDQHAAEMTRYNIAGIDLVVVNFYPFASIIHEKTIPWEKAIEEIDIGGPTMVRAAAKNFAWVAVVVDPEDYPKIAKAIAEQGGLDEATRCYLAEKAFATTAAYDKMIHEFFAARNQTSRNQTQMHHESINLQLNKIMDLRYGENPHQQARAYQIEQQTGVLTATQHQGKELSFNNILDADAAFNCVNEFTEPTCVIVKHSNPCGVATAKTIADAYAKAYQADSVSAFGGIVALNRECDKTVAEKIVQVFTEVVLAPSFSKEALAILASKPNLRLLSLALQKAAREEMKFVAGGVLIQDRDLDMLTVNDLKMVTKVKPSADDLQAMLFAWRVLKHVKSNGILIAKQDITLGIGAGQVSRIDAVDMAVRKADEKIKNAILASDAFFPFRDSIDRIANTGICAIIQPGGSMRDEEVIAACDEQGIAMVFTGKRCFKH